MAQATKVSHGKQSGDYQSSSAQRHSHNDTRSELRQLQQIQQAASSSNNADKLAQLKRHIASGSAGQPIQKANKTGLPDNLKSGMENLSGMSLDNVKVHYNSPKPAAVQAHAYALGNDIHLSAGQEKHLPHELGHVVQQAQGRVNATTSVGGMAVNDNPSLEHEADVMGAKALQMQSKPKC